MEAEIERSFGQRADVTLVPGEGGIFAVSVDDELLFSKREAGRFPDPGEITGLLQAKQ